jgi:hypothetical protein
MKRSSRVQDVDWFNDLMAFRRLNLSPPYQRFSVWSRGYKQYFIDTVLNNLPSPAIFLHKDKDSLDYKYHVVDGKQRLTAIFEFQRNEFPLPKDHDLFPSKYFDDLPSEYQRQFGNYQITVEILTTPDSHELRQVFDRLNRNVRRLNPQELRHARHDGPFITLMENLAAAPFWSEIGIRSPARIKRMQDVEFVSEIFLLTMVGVQDSNPRRLDAYYARYDDEERDSELEEYRVVYEKCLAMMRHVGAEFLSSTRFKNRNDFYSLWAAVKDYDRTQQIDYSATRTALVEFDKLISEVNKLLANSEHVPDSHLDALKYLETVRQGTNQQINRQIRAQILQDLIRVSNEYPS